MKIFKTGRGIVVEFEHRLYLSNLTDWDAYINRDNLYTEIRNELNNLEPEPGISSWLEPSTLAPVGQQEVWAAGVTYLRSRDARMNESKESGGATFYDKVYDAERPELFFKASAQRVMGNNSQVRIRKDSTWNVPEPELTLFITSNGKIAGYTIGNDMSSRSIEGENPLYLPQAKVYDGATALGPCIYVSEQPIPFNTGIHIQIHRGNTKMYADSTRISQMKRTHDELVDYLYCECSFPNGCFLMTGTCLVPPNEFTLLSGDEIIISIDHIGTLTNTVA
ncbi:fumarylacetoacetate hydrolase family protein [Lacibacter sp.]|uniref:fumarylacetoacetate hydrolase family protein n=1 Tax=Lacibacter sp. TaxID=1915409 RepID=UPI002B4AD5D9|nr:fumarylacetoacetate hydrolase family protein [Lacibacter sp.]HLP38201.1 fumarylacetoacetate hydrolase family protein [Lacibacter sp.]